jgi:p21-activated kinase 1
LVTLKDKKGILEFITDFFNFNKQPEISTPHDPVHLTHVSFDSSTSKFTGLPEEWQQLLQDSGISKSDQEKNPLAIMEVVKSYQGGGGDVWDKRGHASAPGSSRSPGTGQAAYPRVSKSLDDSFVPAVSTFLFGSPQPPTATQQQSATVTNLAKDGGATLPLPETMKEDKANGADIVKRLQQICTDADPTRLYRNIVKIGNG